MEIEAISKEIEEEVPKYYFKLILPHDDEISNNEKSQTSEKWEEWQNMKLDLDKGGKSQIEELDHSK